MIKDEILISFFVGKRRKKDWRRRKWRGPCRKSVARCAKTRFIPRVASLFQVILNFPTYSIPLVGRIEIQQMRGHCSRPELIRKYLLRNRSHFLAIGLYFSNFIQIDLYRSSIPPDLRQVHRVYEGLRRQGHGPRTTKRPLPQALLQVLLRQSLRSLGLEHHRDGDDRARTADPHPRIVITSGSLSSPA